MTAGTRLTRRAIMPLAAAAAAMALAPAGASAASKNYGHTTLKLKPATARALKSLGVTPGLVAPARAGSAGIEFPITDSLLEAFTTGAIDHEGGLSLTAGKTVVDLTEYWITLGSGTLSADVWVQGGANLGRVAILSLDTSKAHADDSSGVTIGPITATLTAAAASALDSTFKTTALTDKTVLGALTISYR